MTNPIQRYAEYYGDAELTKWRELGASDKASNVITLYSMVSQVQSLRVVDIGCGDGAVIQELSRRGFGEYYVGLEVSESGIVCAQKRKYAKLAKFELFDGTHVPGLDTSFDLAILSHVLEHVELPRTLLREAARVATYVFVEVPLELNLRTPHDFHWSKVGHINLYNPLLIRHLVQSTGLRILAEQVKCPSRAVFTFRHPGVRGFLHWAAKAMFLKLAPGLAWRMWSYHCCLIAQAIRP